MSANTSRMVACIIAASCFSAINALALPLETIARGEPPLLLVAGAEDAAAASRAAAPTEEQEHQTLATEPLESCMRRWDPDTHMTKSAWRETCKRVTEERLPYVKRN